MKEILVIGAGTMGNGIAHCFAQHKFKVSLVDVNHENLTFAKNKISSNLDRMINKKVISLEERDETLKNLSFYTKLEECATNSDLVIEAATESKKIKLEIFKTLDRLCKPNTILASNTSSISIEDIASVTKRSDKIIGMHFMNPVPIMVLVEIIKSKYTSSHTTQTIIDLSLNLNKKPVVVNDSPGFVANRILLPMINEAILTLEEGVSGVKEIDQVMTLGMSHPMGPLQLADFIGLDVCLSILNILQEGLKNEKYKPAELIKKMVKDNHLGVKTKQGFYDYSMGMKDKKVANRFV